MGKGFHGGFGNTLGADPRRNLTDNLPELKKHFKTTPEGYFGTKGSSTGKRRIASDDPLKTAKEFFKIATKGGTKDEKVSSGEKRQSYVMKDGSRITMRVTSSSDGTPVIEITVSESAKGQIKNQKIHFVKGN